jgi:hypothetical protein
MMWYNPETGQFGFGRCYGKSTFNGRPHYDQPNHKGRSDHSDVAVVPGLQCNTHGTAATAGRSAASAREQQLQRNHPRTTHRMEAIHTMIRKLLERIWLARWQW